MPTPPRSERGPYSRGRACGNCRRRKVKCDGVKPTCSQCLRLPPSEPAENQICEYSDPKLRRTEEQDLKETIKNLEARIRELEVSSDASVVKLHSPYLAEQSNPEVVLQSSPQNWNIPSPSLLETFFRHATELEFFLHVPRFRHAVTLPVDSPGRPCQGLISTVLLLGLNLTEKYIPNSRSSCNNDPLNILNDISLTDATIVSQEAIYLSRAQIDVAGIISTTHPDRIVHGIQAELLLSTYLFRQGRILEGKYHLSAATSIAFSAKFHKIRSLNADRDMLVSAGLPWVVSTPVTTTFNGSSKSGSRLNYDSSATDSETLLPPSVDPISEGERINAFWTILASSNCWALAADSSPNFLLERYIEDIDTPWPMDIEDYDRNLLPEYLGSATVIKLLQGTPIPGDTVGRGVSTLALYVQASILLSRAATVALAYHPNMSSPAAAKFTTNFLELDGVIDRFKTTLMNSSNSSPNNRNKTMLFTTHLIAHLATIVLHSKAATMAPSNPTLDSFPMEASNSGHKRLDAADAIVQLSRQWRTSVNPNPNPFLGSLWLAVGQVLIEEINLVRFLNNGKDSDGSVRETELRDMLDCIFESAQLPRVYYSPLADYLFDKLHKIYRNRLHIDELPK